MDNQKLILFLALSIVVLLLWQAWQEEFGQPVKPVSHEPAPSTGTMPSTSPSAETPTMGPSATKPSEAPSVSQEVTKTGQRIHVVTDVLDAEITSVGGDLRKVDLIRYPVSINKPDEPYPLLEDTQAKLFIAQTGLLSQKNSAPDHYAVFTPEATEYHLQQGKDDIVVRLNWTGPDGLNVGKIYTFHRNSYIVNLDIQVNNTTDKDWSGSMYRQLQRNKASEPGQSRFIYTYTGAVVSTPYNKYEKIKFDNMADWKPKDSYIKGGWEAMVQHYFVASILPEQNQLNHFYTKVVDNIRYIIGMTTEARTVAPGSTENFSTQFYIGPKDQHRMENAAPNLQLTIDYRIFTVISQPLS